MKVSADVAELLRGGLSNAEVSRRTGVHPVKVADARRALGLPDFRDMKAGYVAPPSHREHGTRAKYVVEECRCKPCKRARRHAENHRARQQAYGRWQPYIDAEPVRAHVRELEAYGIGWKRVAALAGVSIGCMSKLLYGDRTRHLEPSKRVRPETAAKILAVRATPENLGGCAVVDGTGTRRRLRALVAGGWPQAQLACRLEMQPTNLCQLLHGAREKVLVATARTVIALYEQLWAADPLTHGVHPQGVSRARNQAREHQWAPVGAWDDDTIDDPAAFPDWTGACGTPEGYNTHYSHKIPMCEPCRQAGTVHRREQRQAQKAVAA